MDGVFVMEFNWSKSKMVQRTTRPLLLNGFEEFCFTDPRKEIALSGEGGGGKERESL